MLTGVLMVAMMVMLWFDGGVVENGGVDIVGIVGIVDGIGCDVVLMVTFIFVFRIQLLYTVHVSFAWVLLLSMMLAVLPIVLVLLLFLLLVLYMALVCVFGDVVGAGVVRIGIYISVTVDADCSS